jgi:hypothetical protein
MLQLWVVSTVKAGTYATHLLHVPLSNSMEFLLARPRLPLSTKSALSLNVELEAPAASKCQRAGGYCNSVDAIESHRGWRRQAVKSCARKRTLGNVDISMECTAQ